MRIAEWLKAAWARRRTDEHPQPNTISLKAIIEALRPQLTPWTRSEGVDHDHDYAAFAESYGNSHPWVFACVDLRATSLASLPLRVFRRTDEGLEADDRNPLTDLLRHTNPRSGLRDLVYSTSVDYDLNGNAYWLLTRTTDSRAPLSELWRLRPDWTKVIPGGPTGVEAYLFGPDRRNRRRLEPEEVIHFRFPHPYNDVYGLSRLLSAALTADTDKRSRENDLDLLKRGLAYDYWVTLKDALVYDEEQAKELQAKLDAKFKGSVHGVNLLAPGVELQEVASHRREMEFEALRRMNREEICGVFGVPPVLVQILDHATYSNFDTAQQMFWGTTMRAHAAALEDALNEHLVPLYGKDLELRFDFAEVDALQDTNLDDQQQDWSVVQGGGLTINEYRRRWYPDLAPLPHGDTAWMPMNLIPADALAASREAPPAPLEPPEGGGGKARVLRASSRTLALPEAGGGRAPFRRARGAMLSGKRSTPS